MGSFEQDCINRTRKFIKFVNFRIFGDKAGTDPAKRLKHVIFFENRTKYGDPTAFHAHALILIPEDRLAKFEVVSPKIWNKLFPSPRKQDIFKQDVYSINPLSDYISKQCNNEYEILVDLP